jgi:hypothetical protein
MKQKSASVAFLAILRATCVSDMPLFWQTMPCSCPNLAHLTYKSCNLEHDRSFLWRDRGVQEPRSRLVVRVSRPTSDIFESVIACVWRGWHLGDWCCLSKHPNTRSYIY